MGRLFSRGTYSRAVVVRKQVTGGQFGGEQGKGSSAARAGVARYVTFSTPDVRTPDAVYFALQPLAAAA